ncbi:hypothetical protein G7046_g1498 [Stylonectria norvegica]|nr:hypothetical protein G7046_g1498 [Stylonectria norvegica]
MVSSATAHMGALTLSPRQPSSKRVDFLCLTKSPVPLGDTEHELRRDPLVCHVCLNLSPGPASTSLPRPGVWMHETGGSLNAQRAAALGDNGVAPGWAGRLRNDFSSFEIEAYLTDIRDSAKAGCISCLLLVTALTKLSGGAVSFDNVCLLLRVVFCKGNVLRISLYQGAEPEEDAGDFFSPWETTELGDLVGQFELYTLPGAKCPWPTIGSFMHLEYPSSDSSSVKGGIVRHIIPNPNSDKTFDMIKGWLDNCKSHHSICIEADATALGTLPKRVIRVGPDTNDSIQVFENDDHKTSINAPYIALSHCWGKSQHLVSTKATLAQWKKNIPFASLPPTFQDAIHISRTLGIQYIWIDSLCIIQDDAKDWEIEASKMASIYNDAVLVLAATGSVDGDGGCLFQRQPYVTLSGEFMDGKPFDIYGRLTSSHKMFGWSSSSEMSKKSWNSIDGVQGNRGELLNYPLLSRAWCFQERLLATRILHFTKTEVVFDCLTSMDCECGALADHEDDPLVPPRRIIKTGHKYVQGTNSLQRLSSRNTPQSDDEKRFAQHHELWRDLVVQYSQKGITKHSDGLPAIAGLASKWSNDLTGVYLAGLWEKDLLDGLRWSLDQTGPETDLEYIAPSWSWMSVQRGVTWGLESFADTRYFVDVDYTRTKCHLSGINPFGQVSAGYIFLTGRLTTVTFSVVDNKDDEGGVWSNGVWLQKPGLSQKFCRVDSLPRVRKLPTQNFTCLGLCANKGVENADCALVLCEPDPVDLARQPKEVREHGRVYQRAGIVTRFMAGEWWDVWKDGPGVEEVGMYLI